MTASRDETIGAALCGLEVPEHAPHFERKLRERLLNERSRERFPHRWRRWVALTGVGLAAAAAAAIALLTVPRNSEVATAAEVRALVSDALASARSIGGVVEIEGRPEEGGEGRWSFLLTADGDFSLRSLTDGERITYDAGALVRRNSRGEHFSIVEGEAAGGGIGGPDWVLQQGLGSVVAGIAGSGARIEEVVYQGRDAWLLTISSEDQGRERKGSAVRRVTVDRELGLPVRDVLLIREHGSERRIGEWRLEDLELNVPTPPDAFSLQPGSEQKVSRAHLGFQRVALPQAHAIVDYQPLVARWVPQGFRLVETAAAKGVPAYGGERIDAVSITYRRGLQKIVVETRRRAGDGSRASGTPGSLCSLRSPSVMVCLPDREQRWTREVQIRTGELAGRGATLIVELSGRPRLRASTDDLDVAVAGDVLPAEILRVASSLRR